MGNMDFSCKIRYGELHFVFRMLYVLLVRSLALKVLFKYFYNLITHTLTGPFDRVMDVKHNI